MQLRGVSLLRDDQLLIDSIDLEITAGSITVVMGANGAGKTLLLRVMHGLEAPTSGTIAFADSTAAGEVRKKQAMVFQKPVLLRRSVRANIEFVLGLSGAVDRDECDRVLNQAGLLDRAAQPARMLSGGEQQRLALARALATRPSLLFLDEPTASLDPASALRIEESVVAAHQRGIKIVYVTHDIGQARRLADEVVFLHKGRIAERSDAAQFFSKPSSEAAMAYIEGRILV